MNSSTQQHDRAHSVVQHHAIGLMQRHGLSAIGVGLKTVGGIATDEIAIKAFTPYKLPPDRLAPERLLPPYMTIDGQSVATDVETMATPSAPPSLTTADVDWAESQLTAFRRERPMVGGDSLSHASGTLGTLAAVAVNRSAPHERLVVSCNHVLAALNSGRIGDPIVQPAAGDGGTAFRDRCARLLRWVPLRFGFQGANVCDAAVGLLEANALPHVHHVGPLIGVRSANALPVGSPVFKVGHTTQLTRATVAAVHVSLWIRYTLSPWSWAFFTDQVLTLGGAAFGDSGALLFDKERNAVGMLFSGSLTHAVYNDILNVQNTLDIALITSAH